MYLLLPTESGYKTKLRDAGQLSDDCFGEKNAAFLQKSGGVFDAAGVLPQPADWRRRTHRGGNCERIGAIMECII